MANQCPASMVLEIYNLTDNKFCMLKFEIIATHLGDYTALSIEFSIMEQSITWVGISKLESRGKNAIEFCFSFGSSIHPSEGIFSS